MPSSQAPNLPKQPTLRQGLAAVRANVLARGMDTCFTAQNGAADFCDTEASEEIQAAISRRYIRRKTSYVAFYKAVFLDRMEGFPQASVTSERHWSRCYIPIGNRLADTRKTYSHIFKSMKQESLSCSVNAHSSSRLQSDGSMNGALKI